MFKNRKTDSFLQRFLRFFRVGEEKECWLWLHTKDSKGYGRFGYKYKTYMAHRASYEFFVDTIPNGLVIDHLCRNTSCVNPKHLEPVSLRVNLERGISYLESMGLYKRNGGGGWRNGSLGHKLSVGSKCRRQRHLLANEEDILRYAKYTYCRECKRESYRRENLRRKLLGKKRKRNRV